MELRKYDASAFSVSKRFKETEYLFPIFPTLPDISLATSR
jgi:hypothetical protein